LDQSQPGLAVVITPLISLIHDQVTILRALRIPTCAMAGDLTKEDSRAILASISLAASAPRAAAAAAAVVPSEESPRILFVTPEKLVAGKMLKTKLEAVFRAGRLARIVIDEAHCCVEWGHEFRPDYRKLGFLREVFPSVPILALTATATRKMAMDIIETLHLRSCQLFVGNFDRPNLFYGVLPKADGESAALKQLHELVAGRYAGTSGIIYALTRAEAERVANHLKFGHRAERKRASHVSPVRAEKTVCAALFTTARWPLATNLRYKLAVFR
jgi:RecQ family ATP-dependent DNA helicase